MKRLKPYVRAGLDVLFIALNPPAQSSFNGHWFSGKSSRFFHLLHQSGLLIRKPPPKEKADEIVFGSTKVNYKRSKFGVIDLVHDLVETNSSKVHPTKEHVKALVKQIRKHKPRLVCVIHSKVRDALQRHGKLKTDLTYGNCGAVLRGCQSCFFVNYFPNGNNVSDRRKLQIFCALRKALSTKARIRFLELARVALARRQPDPPKRKQCWMRKAMCNICTLPDWQNPSGSVCRCDGETRFQPET